jgi:hypothetical protein
VHSVIADIVGPNRLKGTGTYVERDKASPNALRIDCGQQFFVKM